MNAIKFLTDFEGKKVGLFIDFEIIAQAKASGEDLGEFLDDIQDTVAIELSRLEGGESRPFDEIKAELSASEN